MLQDNISKLFPLSAEEQDLLKSLKSKLDLGEIINSFYDKYTKHEVTAPFFAGQDISSLKSAQGAHWAEMMEHADSADVAQKSIAIGQIHEKIGLTPDIYLAGYSHVFEELLDKGIDTLGLLGRGKRKTLIRAVTRLLMRDVAASLQAYTLKYEHSVTTSAVTGSISVVMDDAVALSMASN